MTTPAARRTSVNIEEIHGPLPGGKALPPQTNASKPEYLDGRVSALAFQSLGSGDTTSLSPVSPVTPGAQVNSNPSTPTRPGSASSRPSSASARSGGTVPPSPTRPQACLVPWSEEVYDTSDLGRRIYEVPVSGPGRPEKSREVLELQKQVVYENLLKEQAPERPVKSPTVIALQEKSVSERKPCLASHRQSSAPNLLSNGQASLSDRQVFSAQRFFPAPNIDGKHS